ncbi:phenylalanine--tRNA ligase subunit beta [Arsenophonus symbiont of Ornithomya chloropus]|uniref:phenylalanine--tRNA ligase subunit beta n=1 Tax=Arsenophonus symbiont of Ornithomya chloropus TaxID=634121 RepID=UPI0032B2912D
MKFSEYWLREWVNPEINTQELSDQMTMAGLEIKEVKPVAGQFQGVVIGEIVECNQHPNINSLFLITIKIGLNNFINIIYDNVKSFYKGSKVAVAMIGAILPDNVMVKVKIIGGKSSEGILCSYSTLGIYNNYSDIIQFPYDAPIGMNIREYLKLDDCIFELSLTPNRADCLSILGLARDVSAINNLRFNAIKIKSVEVTENIIFPIHIAVPNACPRFLGRVIKGINLKAPIPIWMKERLNRSGIRSINAVLDITNYVLLEIGQPLHVYDIDKLHGTLIVRMAKFNENLVLLDNRKIILNQDTVVIADEKNIVGIAGIFGGKYSGINEYTTNIFLESAFFNPLSIIGRARNYGLHTEASHRFERGVDPQIQYTAMERASKLIIDICGGRAGDIVSITSETDLPKKINILLTQKKIYRLIGHNIDNMQVTKILKCLGFQVFTQKDSWKVTVPSWRFDIQIEEDLIEEIIRIYGYQNIPNIPLNLDLMIPIHNFNEKLSLKRVKTLLIDRGYNEVITYSFVDPKIQKLLHPKEKAMILLHPISVNMSEMRLSLLPGLLTTVIYNQNRQQNRIRIFETGLRFVPDVDAKYGVRQEFMLSGIISGYRYEEHWLQEKRFVDFFDIKGDLELILSLTGKLDNIVFKNHFSSLFHPGQSSRIYLNDHFIGHVGAIHPAIENKLKLYNRIFFFELLWDAFKDCAFPSVNRISRFPCNRRDISIVVSKKIPAADILAECKKSNIKYIVDVNLFDVYCGKGVAEGYKSLAISLTLQDTLRTLEEKDIVATVNKCVAALKQRFQAYLRE